MQELIKKVEFTNLNEVKVAIKAELECLAEGCITLGYLFKQTRDKELYKEDGYESILEFAKAEFNLGKSSVYSYMSINDKFSVEGNSLEIDEKFREFGSSKLAEMLTLTDSQMENITPDATVKDIREYKQITNGIKDSRRLENAENTGAESDFKAVKNSLYEVVEYHFKNEGRGIFEKIIKLILSDDPELETKIMFAIAPSKFKSTRMQATAVIFQEKLINIMKIGQVKETYTYADLIKAIDEVFEPFNAESPKDTFKRHYLEDLVPPVQVKVEIKNVKEEKVVEKPIPAPEKVEEEQIPGQVNIDEIPEVLPEQIKEPFPELEEAEEIEEIVEDTEDEFLNDIEEELDGNQEQDKMIEEEVEDSDNPLSCKFDNTARCLVASKNSCTSEDNSGCMYLSGTLEEDNEEEQTEILDAAAVVETVEQEPEVEVEEASVAAVVEETLEDCHIEISGKFGNKYINDEKLEAIKQFISKAMNERKSFTVDIKIID